MCTSINEIALKPFNPSLYAFTFDDYAYPIEEWVRWHVGILGYDAYILFVGEKTEKMKAIEEKYDKLHVWYVKKKREMRFIDYRAYYKYLAQLTAPQGLKVMLDLDEFIPYKIQAYPFEDRYVGLIKPLIVYRGIVYEDEGNMIGRDAMRRIHTNYTPVLGDGAEVMGEINQNLPILPVLHLQFKNCYEITRKSWLWKTKGNDYCGSIDDLHLKQISFAYDPRLKEIIKGLPAN